MYEKRSKNKIIPLLFECSYYKYITVASVSEVNKLKYSFVKFRGKRYLQRCSTNIIMNETIQTQSKWGFYCEGTVLLKVTVTVLVNLVLRTSGAQLKVKPLTLSGEHYNNTSNLPRQLKSRCYLLDLKQLKRNRRSDSE